MPRTFKQPYHKKLERERIQREHPNRTRLTREQREERKARVEFKQRKAAGL